MLVDKPLCYAPLAAPADAPTEPQVDKLVGGRAGWGTNQEGCEMSMEHVRGTTRMWVRCVMGRGPLHPGCLDLGNDSALRV